MNRITLKDDGRLVFGEQIVATDPLRYLGFGITLAPTCSLRTFFRCLLRYPALSALNPFIATFLEGYAQADADGCRCDGLDYLALWRTVEIIGHPAPSRMELCVSLNGFSKGKRCDIRQYWLESLLDVPLMLGRLNHVVFGDVMDSMQFDTVFSLFDLIDGICWQLSFHQHPAACRLNL